MSIKWKDQLTGEDLQWAVQVSQFRYKENNNDDPQKLITGFVGAVGEIFISKITRIKPEILMMPRHIWLMKRHTYPDIGIFEVKTTTNPVGALYLSDSDTNGAFAILVVAPNGKAIAKSILSGNKIESMTVHAVGWADVSKVKQGPKGMYNAYSIEQRNLEKMDKLDKLVEYFKNHPGKIYPRNLPSFTVESNV